MSSLLLAKGRAFVKGLALVWGLKIAAGCLGFLAFNFALLAGFLALRPLIGPIYAALAVAGGLLLCGAILIITAKILQARRRRQAQAFAATVPLAAAVAPTVIGLSKRAPAFLALALAAVGVFAARRKNPRE